MQTDGKQAAAELLRQKQNALCEEGLARLPQRSDFSAEEVVLIKAHLGPWPRALEAAGLKIPRGDAYAERRREHRIAAKRRKTAAKIRRQNNQHQSNEGEKES